MRCRCVVEGRRGGKGAKGSGVVDRQICSCATEQVQGALKRGIIDEMNRGKATGG